MVSGKVNRNGLGAWPSSWKHSWWWVFCIVSHLVLNSLHCVSAEDENSKALPVVDGMTCTHNLSIRAGSLGLTALTPEIIPRSATAMTFKVKACSDVRVFLHNVDLQSDMLLPSQNIEIVLGLNNQPESSIRDCNSIGCTTLNSTTHNPLNCTEFRSFSVSWSEGVQVHTEEEGNWTTVLNTSQPTLNRCNMFVGYSGEQNTTTEWKIDISCSNDTDGKCPVRTCDMSSDTSGGLVAGAVIGGLLFGFLLGALAVYFGPRVFELTRSQWQRRQKTRPDGEDGMGEGRNNELDTPMLQTSPPTSSDRPVIQGPRRCIPGQESRKALPALPGDDPPALPSTPRPSRTGNAYTPYHQMGGNAGPATDARGTPSKPSGGGISKKRGSEDGAESTNPPGSATARETRRPSAASSHLPAKDGGDRKRAGSGGGGGGGGEKTAGQKGTSSAARALSPLPPLPRDASPKPHSPAAAEDMYINADAHVYEGMHHDGPIYENRDTGMYEALLPSPNKDAKK